MFPLQPNSKDQYSAVELVAAEALGHKEKLDTAVN